MKSLIPAAVALLLLCSSIQAQQLNSSPTPIADSPPLRFNTVDFSSADSNTDSTAEQLVSSKAKSNNYDGPQVFVAGPLQMIGIGLLILGLAVVGFVVFNNREGLMKKRHEWEHRRHFKDRDGH